MSNQRRKDSILCASSFIPSNLDIFLMSLRRFLSAACDVLADNTDEPLTRRIGMDFGLLLAGLIALGLLIYLIYSLLYPEKF